MIKIKGLKKSFGDLEVIKNIDLNVTKGEIISIIGPSGTGKSTLLRCLNMLEMPTGGEIIIDGEKVDEHSLGKIRQKMGMVFQSFNLFAHLNVIENIILAPIELKKTQLTVAYEEGMKLLSMVGLAEKALSFPDELSGGQKQRVAIARALAMEPEIILFDEPTSALDPTMISEVLSVIKNLAAEGLTMLIVTHEMSFAQQVSTRVLYLDEGGIYEDGPPDQIFKNPIKPKTKAFIRRIRNLSHHFETTKFDHIKLNSDIEEFMRKYALSQKQTNAAQLVFEELFLNTVIPYQTQDNFSADFSLEISELDDILEPVMELSYNGEKFNPLESDKLDDLSEILIRKSSKTQTYSYKDGKNTIKISL